MDLPFSAFIKNGVNVKGDRAQKKTSIVTIVTIMHYLFISELLKLKTLAVKQYFKIVLKMKFIIKFTFWVQGGSHLVSLEFN